jgi:hypothetical protein
MNKTENDFEILKRIMKLQKQSEKELLKIWHTMFDENPEIKSRKYMVAKLAYKIQELAYGGLDIETENKIRNCAKEVTKEKTVASKKTRKFSPMIDTKISKEHGGKIHEVLVVNDGFSYEGTVYKSLSAIATKITGTRWNGLKFFGVKK